MDDPKKDLEEHTPELDGDNSGTDYIGVSLSIGTGLGVALGILLDNLAIGIALGAALGIVAGAALSFGKKKK